MKNSIYILSFLSVAIFFTSCDPNYCADYVIQNELDQDVEILFYTKYVGIGDSIIRLKINSKERERVELLCGMSGSPDNLYLLADDSIHIILENGIILKYTNDRPENTIYDTKNRDIWVEEYGKEKRWQGGDYRYVYTIKQSDLGE